jgi:hypothetical protein
MRQTNVEIQQMAFKKKESNSLKTLETRVAGMREINPGLDLGNGLEVSALEAKIKTRRERLDKYNALLTQADMLATDLAQDDKDCREESSNILSGIKSRFGRDSAQVEAVGGKRLSERKKPTKKES